MYTGIIEELGEVVKVEPLTGGDPSPRVEPLTGGDPSTRGEPEAAGGPGVGGPGAGGAPVTAARISVRGPLVTSDAGHGDSISVNGVCLTVVEIGGDVFTADVMAETLRRSSLGTLAPGDRVNLERSMALGDRLGGHLVQGHVDGVATVIAREPSEHWEVVHFSLPAGLGRYLVEKGSITVDGVSLTVVSVTDDEFAVSLIPTTLALTTLGTRKVGDRVNLEVDVIAKYVEKMLGERS